MGSSQSSIVNDPRKFATESTSNDSKSWRAYDYVIVGGGMPLSGGLDIRGSSLIYLATCVGTAGCVLASRLSENRACTVLLIEAGKT